MIAFSSYRLENRGAGPAAVFTNEWHDEETSFLLPDLECRITLLERDGHDAGIERLALAELTSAQPKLAKPRCTVCRHDVPLYDNLTEEQICRCAKIPNSRGAQCAVALYRATLREIHHDNPI